MNREDTPYAPRASAPVASSPIVGTVRRWDESKGWGFIRFDDGDAFVHHTALIGMAGRRNLKEGQLVRFEVRETPKGFQAVNCVVAG